MINHARIVLLMFLAVCGLGFSLPSSAAIQQAVTNIYFDANDNVIGQELVYCDNYAAYAGQVDELNPNHIRMTFGCGDQLISCSSPVLDNGVLVPNCSPAGLDYGIKIVYFHSATGRTQADYCNAGTTGPFAYSEGCDTPAPAMLINLGTFTKGFAPG